MGGSTVKAEIAFIGIGIMGSKMANNLLAAGYSLRVCDLNAKALETFAGRAICTTSVAEAITGVEVVITMLPDSPQVEALVFQPAGLLEIMKPNSVLIDMSTILPDSSRKVAEALAARQIGFLDAPVTGGEDSAANGTLSILVGGPHPLFTEMQPILSCMGRRITHMGEWGAGQMAKLCNQIIGALTLQAVCEGLMMAAKSGIDLPLLAEALKGGTADSFMLDYLSVRFMAKDLSPGFKISLEQKDLRNALVTGEAHQVPLPALALVHQMFMARVAAGGSETEGNHALIRVYEDLCNHYFTRQPHKLGLQDIL